jgi:VIT1/CCC1 family predicted Fe2+/Mn2+ transporter
MAMHSTKLRRRKPLGWLPAAVLGADDGLVSTASLVLGVAAAHASHSNILVAGTAGLVAGAMSMAASEYVSVHALSDYEAADTLRRHAHLKVNTRCAHDALVTSYLSLGLNAVLAKEVADGLMARRAHPNQAALAAAGSFAIGAAIPIIITVLVHSAALLTILPASALVFLALLGGSAAHLGGARVLVGALRVTFWGALAMALTAGVGMLFGAAV